MPQLCYVGQIVYINVTFIIYAELEKKGDKLKQIVFSKELEDNQIYLSTNASLLAILLCSKVKFF